MSPDAKESAPSLPGSGSIIGRACHMEAVPFDCDASGSVPGGGVESSVAVQAQWHRRSDRRCGQQRDDERRAVRDRDGNSIAFADAGVFKGKCQNMDLLSKRSEGQTKVWVGMHQRRLVVGKRCDQIDQSHVQRNLLVLP